LQKQKAYLERSLKNEQDNLRDMVQQAKAAK
jgi:hypothetical protein